MLFFCSGSSGFQPVNVTGFDGPIRSGPSAGFSDDEGSLSPPRHSYILEHGTRHQHHHSAGYSDDELALTSSDDAIAFSGDFCNYEPSTHVHHESAGPHYHHHGHHEPGRRARSSSQGRHRSEHSHHSHYTTLTHPSHHTTQHYYPDAL